MLIPKDIIGINANQKNIVMVSNDSKYVIYGIGGIIIKKNLDDDKILFNNVHDNEISAIDIDNNNKYIASGQLENLANSKKLADIVILDYNNLQEIKRFSDFNVKVSEIKFSNDGKFLAAIGEDNKLVIYCTEELYIVYSQYFETTFLTISWEISNDYNRKNFNLYALNETNIIDFNVSYDIGYMKYTAKSGVFGMPNSGLRRKYNCSLVINDTLYAGSNGGELVIYDLKNKLFKSLIQIGKSSLLCIKNINNNEIIAGFNDGTFILLNVNYTDIKILYSKVLEQSITNMYYKRDTNYIFILDKIGNIYKYNNNIINMIENSNTNKILDMNFNKTLNVFGTIDNTGIAKIWDLNKKLISFSINFKVNNSNISGSCIWIDNNSNLICGYTDGSIKLYEFNINEYYKEAKKIHEIIPAHKGKVSSIFMNNNYIISAGEEYIMRIWGRSNKLLIKEINCHDKLITKILPDISKSNIIHSCSYDKQIHSFDIKIDKKIGLHCIKNGNILDMDQLNISEKEIITCGFNCNILFWDKDILDPVKEIIYKQKNNTISISPNNKYISVGTADCFIGVFDIKTGKLVSEIKAHSLEINRIFWVSDSKLISSSLDGSIFIWDLCFN